MRTALQVLEDHGYEFDLPDHPVGPDLVDDLPDPDLSLELDVKSVDVAIGSLAVLNQLIADEDHLATYTPRPEWRELIAT